MTVNLNASLTQGFGITSDTSGVLTFQSNAAETMRIDTSGNVGIGTTSPGAKLDVTSATGGNQIISRALDVSVASLRALNTSGNYGWFVPNSTNAFAVYDYAANTERMRIDASGNLLVGTTTTIGQGGFTVQPNVSVGAAQVNFNRSTSTNGSTVIVFRDAGTLVGSISYTNTTTTYGTSSDYRLKENVTPMTTGLAKISALKPVTYDWISDKSEGEGFIAHELQTVIPLAVTGEKDAVNEDGSIKPQGVDYSKIVVHLVAAIQELKATVDVQASEIAALKAKVGA